MSRKASLMLEGNVGYVFKVPIGENQHIYAVLLPDFTYHFFDRIFNEEIDNLSDLIGTRKLLRVGVMGYIQTKKLWPRIGKIDLIGELAESTWFCIKSLSRVDSNGNDVYHYFLAKSDDATTIATTEEECSQYEQYAVWPCDQLVERIRKIYKQRV